MPRPAGAARPGGAARLKGGCNLIRHPAHLYGCHHSGQGPAAVEGAGDMTPAEEFTEFAEATSPRLRRAAFLLCGDWHTAEDLAQTALAKVFVSWRTLRRHDAAHAYATRTLVNTYLAHQRLKRTGEVLAAVLPPGGSRRRRRKHGSSCSARWPPCRRGPARWWCCATGRT